MHKQQEERQALLHEGSGSAAVNAFVEIVFDNSDQRLTIDTSDEVVLRRTIGLKKDEFFLQRQVGIFIHDINNNALYIYPTSIQTIP